ncbi:MAG TPA: acylphosphatase [Gemmatimonadaceae bacterium]|nr:acylphosphatase [Gemmatimonadaceae bacterium]HZF73288.1 acylphosphatase [Gemmatimonadaceae bacterium]
MESIHLEIHGRVQGVGFRWYVVEKAHQLKLAGWVRNNSDGKVEIAAAGDRDALARLEAAVKSGPRGARVEEVRNLSPVSVESLPTPFEIMR